MSKYRFEVELKIYGYIDAEVPECQTPDDVANELEENGLTPQDLTYIRDDEIDIDDWNKL